MVSDRRQIVGLALAIIGFLGSIVTCGLPIWKVRRIIAGIIAPQVYHEGLWMFCVGLYTEPMQCRVYDSDQNLSPDLQAARTLVIISIIFGIFGILLGIAGGKCTNFIKGERQKCKVAIAAGAAFIISCLLLLIPVCWTANTIIRDSHSLVEAYGVILKLGASIYVGWGAAGLLVLGGGLLSSSCPPSDENSYDVKYSKALYVESINALV